MYDGNPFVMFITRLGMNFVSAVKIIVLYVFSPLKKGILYTVKRIYKGCLRFIVKIKAAYYDIKRYSDEKKEFKQNGGITKREFYKISRKKHHSLISYCFNCIAVIVSLCIVSGIAVYFKDYSFALKVVYDDGVIGYAQNENDVFESRRNADMQLSMNGKKCNDISYSVVFAESSLIDTVEVLTEKFVKKTDSSYNYACGIYVDNEFLCAVNNLSDAYDVFDGILSDYRLKDKTENVKYSFNSDIKCVYGLYPSDSNVLWQKNDLLNYLNKNPIQVKMQKTNTYDVDLKYDTVNINSDAIYQGNSTVLQEGQNGTQKVTDILTYVNGVQVAKSELLRITVKPAVSKRVAIGTRIASVVKYTKSFGGVMLWPAPQNCFYLSSYFGYRWGSLHGGIDIISSDDSSCRGRPVVAAAAGRVIAAQYHWSWGNYIKIDHGNGIATLYAHMLDGSFCVNEGDYVYAGQQIGSIGTTGNSTGYHLHFEVYVNGTRVDPLPFVYSEKVQYYD